MMSPAFVTHVSSPPTILAIPKSVSLTAPPAANIRFAGFTSRCSTRCRCAAANPAAQDSAIATAVAES